MRKEYEMTPAQLAKIMEACEAVPYLVANGTEPCIQDNVNAAWDALGKEMGFDFLTVRPNGKGDRFFTAESLI